VVDLTARGRRHSLRDRLRHTLRLVLVVAVTAPALSWVSISLPVRTLDAGAATAPLSAVLTVGGNGQTPVTSWPNHDPATDPSLVYPNGPARSQPVAPSVFTSGNIAGKSYLWFIQGNVLRQYDTAANTITTIGGTNYTTFQDCGYGYCYSIERLLYPDIYD
jgi:hypothetical protein